jgi:vacuolar-type H+-ATPase subunit H
MTKATSIMRIRDSKPKEKDSKAGKKKAEGRFWTIEDKLDEAELFAFIEGLIEQNSELGKKVECLESLADLAEKTVIEAEKQAESMREEAEQRSDSIHRKAKEAAKKIIAEARQAVEADAQEMLAAAERQSQEMIAAAEAEAQQKLAEAEQQSQQMIKGAQDEGQNIVADVRKCAEDEGSRIIAGARQCAEEEAERIRQEAEGLLASGSASETDIRESVRRALLDLGIRPNGSGEGDARTPALQGEVRAQGSPERGKGNGRGDAVLYRGHVELLIRPPVTMREGLRLHKELTKNDQIKVTDVQGSADRGMIMKLLVRADTPLLDLLQAEPTIGSVACVTAKSGGGGAEAPKIVVGLKR